jgi:N-acetyl-gamma-glutamyl-phosphate reductase
MVAARIVAGHPNARLTVATSDKWAGERVAEKIGIRGDDALSFVPNDQALVATASCDVVLLATSAEVSHELAPKLRERGTPVIDLSGAFRLADAADYAKWYALEHRAPALLAAAHYGLPELFGAPPDKGLVANPGCYPTASILPLAPLLREGLIDPGGIVVDAKSGVTGAGRQSKEQYSFTEIDGDFRAYKVLSHQHTPEIARALGRAGVGAGAASVAGRAVSLTFTAHLLPVKRGILATCYGRPRPGASRARVAECLADSYRGAAFVRCMKPEAVTLAGVVGTNEAHLGATADDEIVVAFAAIDNLVKGAAGQAVQNLNLMFGLPETAGLDTLLRSAP